MYYFLPKLDQINLSYDLNKMKGDTTVNKDKELNKDRELNIDSKIKKVNKPRLTIPTIIPKHVSQQKILDNLLMNKSITPSKTIGIVSRIGKNLSNDETFLLLKHLLLGINLEKEKKNSVRYEETVRWQTFFSCLEYLPNNFYNQNLDITALIILKCYEFLMLETKNDNSSIKNLQEKLEKIIIKLINKINTDYHSNLKLEILNGNLPYSSQHQYDTVSLNHYILKNINVSHIHS